MTTPASPGPVSDDLGLQLWLVDLAARSEQLLAIAAAHNVLSDDEIAWNHDTIDNAGTRYRQACRAALRLLLHRAGAKHAFARALHYSATGKPELQRGGPSFNVSHSRHLGLIALGPVGPLGVDLEFDRPVQIFGARRALLLAACDALTNDRGGDDDTRLISGWTCLEALAKARGSGIGRLLTDLGITAAGGRRLTAGDITARTNALVADCGLRVATLSLGGLNGDRVVGLRGAVVARADLYGASHDVRSLDEAACHDLAARAGVAPGDDS